MLQDNCVVAIGGVTASGKSALAVRYAEYLNDVCGVNAEIINADSTQLFSELKILTAYPSVDDFKKVKHHLFGVLTPNETTSVSLWLKLAIKKINELHQSNKFPILCGGTGLYLNAIRNGMSNIPEIPSGIRKYVFERFNKIGRDEFYTELIRMDKNVVNTIHKNNTQRILRAYEVVFYTNRTLSDWWNERCHSGYNIKYKILMPPKEYVHNRCYLRIEKMMLDGAIDEVKVFMEKYPNYHGPLTNIIGYKEIALLLANEITKEQCIEQMFIRTKQYAKRQYTWFRNQL